jgi:hypothetical protein
MIKKKSMHRHEAQLCVRQCSIFLLMSQSAHKKYYSYFERYYEESLNMHTMHIMHTM